MYDMILVRFGEMTLKKANYKIFLKKIISNIKSKLQSFPKLTFNNTTYRFYIYLNGEDVLPILEVLQTIVGIYSFSLCKKTTSDLDAIAQTALFCLDNQPLKLPYKFKVETNRADKTYPLTSIQISQEIAKRILPLYPGLKVDVHNPDVVLSIDMRYEGTYLYTQVIKGLGGYPSGIAGRGLVMISGGIDSPVASYLALRKGMQLEAIHFASYPYTSNEALQKVIDLLERISVYTENSSFILHVIPFTDIQLAIKEKVKTTYLMTIMRRSMLRLSTMLAKMQNLDAIINGESIGQVASQTIESMKVVNEVTNMPVIRPLATYDKEDIIKIAKEIKTYDISIIPYEDCCTIFVPQHPIIKPKLDEALKEEAKIDFTILEEKALQSKVVYKVSSLEKTLINPYKKYEI